MPLPPPPTDAAASLYFLGPKSEQRKFLEESLGLVLQDYIFWRRNYYPKDPPAISYHHLHSPEALHLKETFIQELFSFIADLKLDVPVFSPRYMAHMVSETTLPSLVAYIATLLYNPNNVSTEASPVTTAYELEVGQQFAELFGYPKERAFGHLTSGGTVANYESLWYNRAAKYLPLSMGLALRLYDIPWLEGLPSDVWSLMNLSYERIEALYRRWLGHLRREGWQPSEVLKKVSYLEYGEAGFRTTIEETFQEACCLPVVLLPETAHYGWKRAAGLFGFGRKALRKIPVDRAFRMSVSGLREALEESLDTQTAILQTVVVIGTTEYGSVDPLPDIVALREEFEAKGLFSPIHLDAAFGGYMATIFRGRDGKALATEALPPFLEGLRSAFAAFRQTESVTVDPHKLGFVPYGAGAIVHRYGFLRDLVTEEAAYCLDEGAAQQTGGSGIHLGSSILEGSKPGAAAAAVWFSHKMIPLSTEGYGKIMLALCENARLFVEKLRAKNEALASHPQGIRFLLVAEPSMNLVCLLPWASWLRTFSDLNRLSRHLFERFGVKATESIQVYDYLISHTAIPRTMAFVEQDPDLQSLRPDVDTVDLLRLVFMNSWLQGHEAGGKMYIDDFLDRLVASIQACPASGGRDEMECLEGASPPQTP